MIEIIVYLIITIPVVGWYYLKWNNRNFEKLAARMPGPPSYPIVGTGLEFLGSAERKENNLFIKNKYNKPFMYIFFIFIRGHEQNNLFPETL